MADIVINSVFRHNEAIHRKVAHGAEGPVTEDKFQRLAASTRSPDCECCIVVVGEACDTELVDFLSLHMSKVGFLKATQFGSPMLDATLRSRLLFALFSFRARPWPKWMALRVRRIST